MFRGRAVNQRHIFLDHGPFLNGPGQSGGSGLGAGVDHDAANIFVQPVQGENFPAQRLC